MLSDIHEPEVNAVPVADNTLIALLLVLLGLLKPLCLSLIFSFLLLPNAKVNTGIITGVNDVTHVSAIKCKLILVCVHSY